MSLSALPLGAMPQSRYLKLMVVVLALGELIAQRLDYTQLAIPSNKDSNTHNDVVSLQTIGEDKQKS